MIKKSLLWKLILAFVFVSLVTTALVAVLIRMNSVDSLTRLVLDQQRSNLQSALTDYYTQNGSWQGIAQAWPLMYLRNGSIRNIPNNPLMDQPIDPAIGRIPRDMMPTLDRRSLFGLVDMQGRVIVPFYGEYAVGDTIPADLIRTGTPVMVNNTQVGVILTAAWQPRLNPEENLFLQRTNEALIYSVIGATLLSLLIAILLSRNLIRPLQELTQAAQNMARGKLDQQVNVRSQDEVGRLADAFNRMSQEVGRSNQLRRQMTADIAHDLRTPLTVIAGYVESMRDGVLQPTNQRLSIIYQEIERLQDLVGDLKLLSLADSGELPMNPQPIAPLTLLEQAAAPFQPRAMQQEINLRVVAPDNLPMVRVDVARMMQVFGNLVSNAMRYTPAGGEIKLFASQQGNQVRLSVQDTGSGIPAEELPLIFDRFHRADPSRHTDDGESGLGLAIVRALVEAHQGHVNAQSELGKGTTISFEIPALP